MRIEKGGIARSMKLEDQRRDATFKVVNSVSEHLERTRIELKRIRVRPISSLGLGIGTSFVASY